MKYTGLPTKDETLKRRLNGINNIYIGFPKFVIPVAVNLIVFFVANPLLRY